MKTSTKLGLTGALAAFALLAAATPALADPTTGTQNVTGEIDGTLALNVAQPTVDFGTFTPGQTATIDAGSVTVQANEPYVLTLTDDGGLTPNAGTTYLGSSLEASSSVDSTTGATAQADPAPLDTTVGTAGAGVRIGSGTAATDGDVFDVNLSQPVAWTDTAADYQDALTYTLTPNV